MSEAVRNITLSVTSFSQPYGPFDAVSNLSVGDGLSIVSNIVYAL